MDLAATERFAFGAEFFQAYGVVGADHDIGATAAENLGSKRAERAGRPGDDRGLAFDAEQGERILQEVFGHCLTTFWTVMPAKAGIQ